MTVGFSEEDPKGASRWLASVKRTACVKGLWNIPQILPTAYRWASVSATVRVWSAVDLTVADQKVGYSILTVNGLSGFYYVHNFTDMRCKYNRVLAVIRLELGREPRHGEVFIVMSMCRWQIRLLTYDRISCIFFLEAFVPDYEFMKMGYG